MIITFMGSTSTCPTRQTSLLDIIAKTIGELQALTSHQHHGSMISKYTLLLTLFYEHSEGLQFYITDWAHKLIRPLIMSLLNFAALRFNLCTKMSRLGLIGIACTPNFGAPWGAAFLVVSRCLKTGMAHLLMAWLTMIG